MRKAKHIYFISLNKNEITQGRGDPKQGTFPYTFEKISNYHSHGKTINIIRIIIMLFCARQGAKICRSAYSYLKNS